MMSETGTPSAQHVDALTPTNEQAVALLPPLGVQCSHDASTVGGVVRVYPEGLAFVDQLGAMRGYLSSFGILSLPLLIAMVTLGVSAGYWLPLVVVFFMLWMALVFIQVDWVGFRYEPVLLNRAWGKVHVFKAKGLPWWQWGWKLWGRTRYEIATYDWSCVRAEVVEFTIFTGQIPRRESGLVFAITDVAGGSNVVQRFGVGPSLGYGDLKLPMERWEHLRRFMRFEGPIWTPKDSLYEDLGVKFWPSFWLFQPLFGGESAAWRPTGLFGYIGGVAMLFFLPITAYIGLVRYLSFRMKREPAWSREILDSLGGAALTAEQLDDMVRGTTKAKSVTSSHGKRKR